jgi:hypothetical protein
VEAERLLGRWELRRRVADRRAGLVGAVHGELTLSTVDDGVRWAETGTLHWDGRRMPVHRTLLVRDGFVYFEDGRPFHPWRPGETVVHPCAVDVYTGLVVVDRDATRLRTLWDVRGPAKDQRLVTRCVRLGR